MKKVSTFLFLSFILICYKSNSSVGFPILTKSINYASTSLTVFNNSTTASIYSVRIDIANPIPGGPTTYTYSTNIPPGASAAVDLVGLPSFSGYVTLTLSLSHNTTGILRDWYWDRYEDLYYDMGCQSFNHTTQPSLYFYLYSYNYLQLNINQSC